MKRNIKEHIIRKIFFYKFLACSVTKSMARYCICRGGDKIFNHKQPIDLSNGSIDFKIKRTVVCSFGTCVRRGWGLYLMNSLTTRWALDYSCLL